MRNFLKVNSSESQVTPVYSNTSWADDLITGKSTPVILPSPSVGEHLVDWSAMRKTNIVEVYTEMNRTVAQRCV